MVRSRSAPRTGSQFQTLAASEPPLLTGKAAMADWTTDAPGVRREIRFCSGDHGNKHDLAGPV